MRSRAVLQDPNYDPDLAYDVYDCWILIAQVGWNREVSDSGIHREREKRKTNVKDKILQYETVTVGQL